MAVPAPQATRYVGSSAHTGRSNEIVTFSSGQPLPDELNGIAFSVWRPSPFTPEAWSQVESDDQDDVLESEVAVAATVIIVEPDLRVWMIRGNGSGDMRQLHFPSAPKAPSLSLRATALREAWEKTGLRICIECVLGDIEEDAGVTRYYLAVRTGGAPMMTGWECSSLSLIPLAVLTQIGELLGTTINPKVLAALQASLEMHQAMRETNLEPS